jgi:hypothetical protein
MSTKSASEYYDYEFIYSVFRCVFKVVFIIKFEPMGEFNLE